MEVSRQEGRGLPGCGGPPAAGSGAAAPTGSEPVRAAAFALHGPYRAAAALALVLVAAVTPASCVRTVHLGTEEVAQDIRQETTVRSAQNLPLSFTVVTPARIDGDCPVRLRDDVVGTVLDLRRSMMVPSREGGSRLESVGDYRATPQGRYGDTEPGDGIRVDCTRLRPMGIITLGAPGG